jgi:hypothetical protein
MIQQAAGEALFRENCYITGPHFKDESHYLSHDGDNPQAPWPRYGWPLGTECWYFYLEVEGRRLWATGITVMNAWQRAIYLVDRISDRMATEGTFK